MEKFYSNIVGTAVGEHDSRRSFTTVKDVVVDPENGKIVAFIVDLRRNLVVTPVDIVFWTDRILISDHDAIIEAGEVLRVSQIQNKNIHIPKCPVETEEGKYLGQVLDFSVGNKDFILKKLFVAKGFWGLFRYENRIISYKNIVEILPKKIIVKNDLQTVKEESSRGVAEDLAAG
jgi:uncharacterized protein YrrD